jgi:hypothetical protein
MSNSDQSRPHGKVRLTDRMYRWEGGSLRRVAEIMVRTADGTFAKKTVSVGKPPKKHRKRRR